MSAFEAFVVAIRLAARELHLSGDLSDAALARVVAIADRARRRAAA